MPLIAQKYFPIFLFALFNNQIGKFALIVQLIAP